MSNTCTILRAIETVSQSVEDFIPVPGTFTAADAANLIVQIQSLIGAVRELPLAHGKSDIINRLNESILILQNGTLGLSVTEQLLAVSQLLQVVTLKALTRPIPCTQGFTCASPSNTFNTICICR
ncbi:MAG: hypothetical protein PVG90_14115 [Bacillota bacterium]|jgi:hypothetical protein